MLSAGSPPVEGQEGRLPPLSLPLATLAGKLSDVVAFSFLDDPGRS